MYKSRNYQLSKVFNKRPYKSRRQRPCDLCRKKKTCCIMRNTDVCLTCSKAGRRQCTFVDGPIKRTVKQISNPPILPSQGVPRALGSTFLSYSLSSVKSRIVEQPPEYGYSRRSETPPSVVKHVSGSEDDVARDLGNKKDNRRHSQQLQGAQERAKHKPKGPTLQEVTVPMSVTSPSVLNVYDALGVPTPNMLNEEPAPQYGNGFPSAEEMKRPSLSATTTTYSQELPSHTVSHESSPLPTIKSVSSETVASLAAPTVRFTPLTVYDSDIPSPSSGESSSLNSLASVGAWVSPESEWGYPKVQGTETIPLEPQDKALVQEFATKAIQLDRLEDLEFGSLLF